MCVFLLLVPFLFSFCECVYECEEGLPREAPPEEGFRIPAMARNTLRNSDRLDDLEDCGAAHHEDEQRQQPRTNGVLLLGILRRLGHVSALGDVAASLLVGHFDSLLGGHCAFVCWLGLGYACKSLERDEENRGRIGAKSNKETTVLC